MDCNTSGFLVFYHLAQSLLKLMSIESMMPSNRLIFCHPFLLLPSILPSTRDFSSKSALLIRGQIIGASASASVFPMNLFSHSGVSNSLRPHGLQHSRHSSFTISQSFLKLMFCLSSPSPPAFSLS